jgi:hypothetical protein
LGSRDTEREETMAVPVATEQQLRDRRGQPIAVGDTVRVEGVADPVEVHAVDPRYAVLIVLVPGRVGKVARMVRAQEVERAG